MLWQLPSRAHHVNLFYSSLTFQCLLIVYLDVVQDLYYLHWGKIPLGTYFMCSQLFLVVLESLVQSGFLAQKNKTETETGPDVF